MSDAKPRGGKIVHDPELKCMGTISKAMQELALDGTPADEANVVAWFRRKYGAKAADGPAKPEGSDRA